ncbi:MAG: hypothetical protein LKF96_10840 [Treponema sp.]|jgi:hypothetical protein|nr:hypothetical protein [Treponema sp.]
MKEIVFQNDKYHMNWLRADFEYGKVRCPSVLKSAVTNRFDGDFIFTEITLTNTGRKPYFSHTGDIGIAFPLQDTYADSGTCLTRRCHTHIFCGGNVSYLMALRMGGTAPHLGMVLTEGSLSDYSIERDTGHMSNDRGCFWLHPSPLEFDAGETKKICWTIFPHQGKDDFLQQLKKFPTYIQIEAQRYVLFQGETEELKITPCFKTEFITVDGIKLQPVNGRYVVQFPADTYGEKRFDICAGEVHTWCKVFVQKRPAELIALRCRFIAQHQQYHGLIAPLEGAYLGFDNEDGTFVYTPENDYNGGRERVGMGMLVAKYLQCNPSVQPDLLEKSLLCYVAYVERELVDVDTGTVCNDIGMDDSFKRLYNLPWFAAFFCEVYRFTKNPDFLQYACRIIERFYEAGGIDFYPIELPVVLLTRSLLSAGMDGEALAMKELFIRHADRISERGLDYPSSEVNYEQSIVAPAADVLFKVFLITGADEYLQAGRQQLAVLDLFNGFQPDYHLYETAVRHWDGHWFGKRRLYGDTFPHYWSALTGNVFELYAEITGEASYFKRAEDSRRGVLPLFFPDGTASCAYVFPFSVNGIRASFYDPYANDQDWGLYFYLRAMMQHAALK